MKDVKIFVTFIGILTTANAQKCVLNMDTLELQGNFDFSKFMGTWFEVKAWFHSGVSVDTLWNDYYRQYSEKSTGMADVLTIGRPKNSTECTQWTGHKLVLGGRLYPARLTLKLKTSRGTIVDKPLYVVATDYDNYALTVECMNRATLYANGTCLPDPNVYVLSRKTALNPADEARVDDIINTKICHTGLDEYRPNIHGKQCELPGNGASTISLRLCPFIALFSVSSLLRMML
ncbi:unnamed protein product [Owenia fusiformis]|uniref:Uncharacterized protein n=1 Tax=Owenia fusiformis TaxID=6347 RepID=A0A8J1UD37_OWEFU|nr:unnamed protein product [Owenia fusiformis]